MRRISRDTEDSSVLARQGEELDAAAEAGRYLVAGEVEDSTVSGAVNLDERPKLGRWMKDPLWHEWDALMDTSLDRIASLCGPTEPRGRFPSRSGAGTGGPDPAAGRTGSEWWHGRPDGCLPPDAPGPESAPEPKRPEPLDANPFLALL
ncbi:recombinase family protein [Streptomyces sp. NPDC059929]|uniref:recombinase family protein n=1 Tax=Streptomyces sp. NPDC059929 TaxID=3347008 RepID=UPI003650A81C